MTIHDTKNYSNLGQQLRLIVSGFFYSTGRWTLCFKKNTLKVSSLSFYIDQMNVPTVEQCRYLGITMCTNNADVDLKRQMTNCMLL